MLLCVDLQYDYGTKTKNKCVQLYQMNLHMSLIIARCMIGF
jgi:hypothetical protein